MQDDYDRLGISPDATLDEIGAAYRAKLRQFPAHSHPQEFKAVRASYEALRRLHQAKSEDFFQMKPLDAEIDPDLLQKLKAQAIDRLQVSVEELLRLTF